MAASIDSLVQIRRDHPQLSALQSTYRELVELWSLYGEWKSQKHDLDEAKQGMTANAPKQLASLETVLGNASEFKSAGKTIQNSLIARFAEWEKHDLEAALTSGELNTDQKIEIEQMLLQWEREIELSDMRDSPERTDDRER